jgi:hypothetical protein
MFMDAQVVVVFSYTRSATCVQISIPEFQDDFNAIEGELKEVEEFLFENGEI